LLITHTHGASLKKNINLYLLEEAQLMLTDKTKTNISTEILIIGGGITGTSTAYQTNLGGTDAFHHKSGSHHRKDPTIRKPLYRYGFKLLWF
jgi:hypothetical protein